ncbi:MAG: acyl carrier protein [bacterium]|nr:acyl carrier protein [bacterium]
MSADIDVRLKKILVEELDLEEDKLHPDANFEEDLDVDSLGVVELLMALEDEFGVEIPDEEAEEITTVGEAAALIRAKLGN